jgi:hypothetical protein
MDLAALYAHDRFQAALGTVFELLLPVADAVPLGLDLVEVRPRRAPPGYEQFAAEFRGPLVPELPQGTYTMRHAGFGEFPLFIVPIARDDKGMYYEACVVRRADATPS